MKAVRNPRGRPKLDRVIRAFNQDDSVAVQQRRVLKDRTQQLFEQSVGVEIDRMLGGDDHPIRILDVGCGSGPWIEAILDHVDTAAGSAVIAIDGIEPASNLAQLARDRFAERPDVTITSGSFEDHEPVAPYDLVYFVDVIQHLTRSAYPAAFEKAHGMLAPGGRLIIIDKERFSRYSVRMAVKRRVRRMPDYYMTAQYPSFRRLVGIGRGIGLRVARRFENEQFRGLVLAKPGPADAAA